MKTRRRLLILAGVVYLLLLATLFPRDFFKPKPGQLTVDDLAVTKAQIASYSLLDDSRGTRQYTIRLSGYQATFQIPADFAPYFAKTRFQSDLKEGDSVSLSIPVTSAQKLISMGTIPVFAVHTASDTYLDEHSTLEAYNKKNTPKPVPIRTSWGPFIEAASIIPLLIFACAVCKIAQAISARPRKPETLSDPQALDESSQRLKKALTRSAPEQKPPATGDSEQELLTTGDSEQKPVEPPQA